MTSIALPPHRLYPQFLPPHSVAGLIAHVLRIQGELKPSKVDRTGVDPLHRQSLSTRNLGPFRDELTAKITSQLPSLVADLGIAPFALSEVELQLVAYRDGAFHKRHRDMGLESQDNGTQRRRLSAVYYFYNLPKAFTGGALRLYPFFPDAAPGGIDIEPVCNQLVTFPSWVQHEVRSVGVPSGEFSDSRFAINCWLHAAT